MTAGESLGAAIHGLKPTMSVAEAESSAKTAGEQLVLRGVAVQRAPT